MLSEQTGKRASQAVTLSVPSLNACQSRSDAHLMMGLHSMSMELGALTGAGARSCSSN